MDQDETIETLKHQLEVAELALHMAVPGNLGYAVYDGKHLTADVLAQMFKAEAELQIIKNKKSH